MTQDTRAALGVLAVITLIIIALGLLKNKIGQSSVRITLGDTGSELLQTCTYVDGSTLTQPTRWGPCPPIYRGFPLKVAAPTLSSPIPSTY